MNGSWHPVRPEEPDHVRAKEPGTAGHQYSFVTPVIDGPRLALGRYRRSSLTRLRSASSIMAMSSSSVVVGSQPSSAFTFAAFPQRAGTSAERANCGSTLTYSLQSSPAYEKAIWQNSWTETMRPVATTYSLGWSAWSISRIART